MKEKSCTLSNSIRYFFECVSNWKNYFHLIFHDCIVYNNLWWSKYLIREIIQNSCLNWLISASSWFRTDSEVRHFLENKNYFRTRHCSVLYKILKYRRKLGSNNVILKNIPLVFLKALIQINVWYQIIISFSSLSLLSGSLNYWIFCYLQGCSGRFSCDFILHPNCSF